MQDFWSPDLKKKINLGSLLRLQALHVKNRAKGVTSCKIFGVLNVFIQSRVSVPLADSTHQQRGQEEGVLWRNSQPHVGGC